MLEAPALQVKSFWGPQWLQEGLMFSVTLQVPRLRRSGLRPSTVILPGSPRGQQQTRLATSGAAARAPRLQRLHGADGDQLSLPESGILAPGAWLGLLFPTPASHPATAGFLPHDCLREGWRLLQLI